MLLASFFCPVIHSLYVWSFGEKSFTVVGPWIFTVDAPRLSGQFSFAHNIDAEWESTGFLPFLLWHIFDFLMCREWFSQSVCDYIIPSLIPSMASNSFSLLLLYRNKYFDRTTAHANYIKHRFRAYYGWCCVDYASVFCAFYVEIATFSTKYRSNQVNQVFVHDSRESDARSRSGPMHVEARGVRLIWASIIQHASMVSMKMYRFHIFCAQHTQWQKTKWITITTKKVAYRRNQ